MVAGIVESVRTLRRRYFVKGFRITAVGKKNEGPNEDDDSYARTSEVERTLSGTGNARFDALEYDGAAELCDLVEKEYAPVDVSVKQGARHAWMDIQDLKEAERTPGRHVTAFGFQIATGDIRCC